MRDPFRTRGHAPQVARSHLALELTLNAFAALGVLLLVRVLLRVLSVDDRLWIGRVAYRFTDPIASALGVLPGAERTLLGDATLLDVTLLAPLLLFPLWLVARGRRPTVR